MNFCKHKYFVIYRGDSSDFPGNQELIVEINTTIDLTGCSAHFQFQDYRIDFDSIPADKKLHLVFPSSETKKFTLGASDAKLWLTYGSGTDEKTRTVENRIHIIVTNNVNEAYNNDDPQAITVTISGGGGGAAVVLDDTVTEESPNGVKSSGIWSWVKSLLPKWLTSDYAEPATVASVADKANKATPSAAGNLAALTADGDIEDSGKTVDDFLPRVSDGPVSSTFDISGPLFMDMDGYIRLGVAGFIYGSFDNILEEMGSKISLRTELDSKVDSFASVGGASATVENGVAKLDDFFTNSNSLLTGTIDAEVISKGTAPDAHLEAPTDEHLKLILADSTVAYDSAKALPYKLTSAIGDRVIATMTLTAASTDITLPAISANDTTAKDFILDVTNAYAVEGVATDAGINIPRTDFKLVTRDGESLTAVTTVKAGKSAFICFTQKSPVVVDGTTYPCWCVIQLPFGDPS